MLKNSQFLAFVGLTVLCLVLAVSESCSLMKVALYIGAFTTCSMAFFLAD